MALKILVKNPKRWGINSPQTKLAVRADLAALSAGGRPAGRPPTVIFLTVGRSRSTARSTAQKQRAKLSGRSTEPNAWPTCTSLCTLVDRPVDRLGNPVDRPGRPPEPGRQQFGSEKHVKNISKNSYKSSKNPQK